MDTLSEKIQFLKSRRAFQNKKARQLQKSSPENAARHTEQVEQYDKIIAWFEEYQKGRHQQSSSLTPNQPDLFSLNPLDLGDLPEDFRKELNISESDEQDAQVVELLRIANRPLDLNELLVGCLRKYDVKHKRALLTARLYRLVKKGEVHTVSKGTYAIGPGDPNSIENEQEDLPQGGARIIGLK